MQRARLWDGPCRRGERPLISESWSADAPQKRISVRRLVEVHSDAAAARLTAALDQRCACCAAPQPPPEY